MEVSSAKLWLKGRLSINMASIRHLELKKLNCVLRILIIALIFFSLQNFVKF